MANISRNILVSIVNTGPKNYYVVLQEDTQKELYQIFYLINGNNKETLPDYNEDVIVEELCFRLDAFRSFMFMVLRKTDIMNILAGDSSPPQKVLSYEKLIKKSLTTTSNKITAKFLVKYNTGNEYENYIIEVQKPFIDPKDSKRGN